MYYSTGYIHCKKLDHKIGSPSQDEQLSEPLCQKMMEENTSPTDKGQW